MVRRGVCGAVAGFLCGKAGKSAHEGVAWGSNEAAECRKRTGQR